MREIKQQVSKRGWGTLMREKYILYNFLNATTYRGNHDQIIPICCLHGNLQLPIDTVLIASNFQVNT